MPPGLSYPSRSHLRDFVTSLRNEKVRNFDGLLRKFMIPTRVGESSSVERNLRESHLRAACACGTCLVTGITAREQSFFRYHHHTGSPRELLSRVRPACLPPIMDYGAFSGVWCAGSDGWTQTQSEQVENLEITWADRTLIPFF